MLYADYANSRGIKTYPDLSALTGEQFDLVVAYYVVEHLKKPLERLRDLRAMLAPGGYIALEVPNVEDALVKLYALDSFDSFYWQKAHYFYYSAQTMRDSLAKAGFDDIMTMPEQRYDISNHRPLAAERRARRQGPLHRRVRRKVEPRVRPLPARAMAVRHRFRSGEEPSVTHDIEQDRVIGTGRAPVLPSPAPGLTDIQRTEPPLPEQGIVRLNRNERAQSLPESFVAGLRAAIESDLLTYYPSTAELYGELSAQLGIPEEKLLLTAGSDSAIKALYQAYLRKGDHVVMLDPSYAMYSVYARMFEAEPLPVSFDRNLSIDAGELLDRIAPGVRIVVVANPNQPTGTLLDDRLIEAVIVRAGEVGALAVIDECYFPFSHTTVLPWTQRFPQLLVVRTFSKAAGLAGLRIGYVVGDASVVGNMSKVRSVADINAVSIVGARQILASPEVVDDFVADVDAGKALLADRVTRLGFDALPTYANFLCIRVAPRYRPQDLADALHAEGFLVKELTDVACLADCIRVTLGSPELMSEFADALERVVDKE